MIEFAGDESEEVGIFAKIPTSHNPCIFPAPASLPIGGIYESRIPRATDRACFKRICRFFELFL